MRSHINQLTWFWVKGFPVWLSVFWSPGWRLVGLSWTLRWIFALTSSRLEGPGSCGQDDIRPWAGVDRRSLWWSSGAGIRQTTRLKVQTRPVPLKHFSPAALAGMKTAQLWTLFLHLSLRCKLQEALWNCNTAGQTCIPETRSWHRAVEEMPKKETPLRDAARQAPRL